MSPANCPVAVRRFIYYAAVAAFGILVHQAFLVPILGDGVITILRRNTEAYALAVLIPAYWDIYAWEADPWGETNIHLRRHPGQYAWLVLLALAAIVVETGPLAETFRLPQSIITLGEAFVAALVITAYQGWSRGFLPGAPSPRGGRPVVSTRTSIRLYVGAILATILVYQGFVTTLLGTGTVEWLQINAESYAAILLVPFYFDFVAPRRRQWVEWAWYAFLVAGALAVAGGRFDETVVGSLAVWVGKTREAFLAALVISIYFTYWRGSDQHRNHSNAEMANGVDQ